MEVMMRENKDGKLVLFDGRPVRKMFHEGENLRDHMTDIELILTMLAEATTAELHRDRDSQGMVPLARDARAGGAVAGRTRKDIETRTGKPVVTGENFKQLSAKKFKKIKSAGPA
jgi:DNA-damage-inducible protein D